MSYTMIEPIKCNWWKKRNIDDESIKVISSCTLIFLAVCVCCGVYINFNLLPPVKWNNHAKEIYANVTHYHIYKDTINYSTKTYGKIYVDFPESGSTFEICDKKGHSDSNKQCKSYLRKHYPIGEFTKLYYNPYDTSDVALDKINIGGEIALTILLSFIVVICFAILMIVLIIAIKN